MWFSMNFDILMPLILFIVTVVALSLGKKAEKRLKATVQEREFKNRDAALMVAMIAVAVSIVVFVPEMAIMAVFLFSYSSLLFTVSYAFSDMSSKRLALYCGAFIVVSDMCIGSLGYLPENLRIPGVIAFGILTAGSFAAWLFARENPQKQKWYLGVLSPILFLLLFFFYRGTGIWFPYLLDVYGIIFALLIVLYIGTLFTWKTVFIFAAFLTTMDIVLVWFTGQMVQAANAVSDLGLPVLVAFPTIPFIFAQGGILIMRLGLGDFFFAGILATQTMKKFGRKIAVASVLTMSISFGLFELVLLNPELAKSIPFQALPATLPIVLGWLPIVAWKLWGERKKKPQVSEVGEKAPEVSV
jgi:hypothetical protein